MKTTVDDDYLICNEYQENIEKKSSVYPDFITFQHTNGNFYFAWVHENSIILRSEAYPDEEKMERGIKAVLKNRDIAERYRVIESHGAHFLCLMGGGDHMKHTGNFENHNEVGRSCPKKSRQELHHLLLVKGKAFADKVIPLGASDMTVPIASAAATLAASTLVEKEKTPSGIASPSYSSSPTNEAKKIVTATAKAATATDTSSGFNWKWLLPLLLLIPLFFAYKNCGGKGGTSATSETATTSATESPVTGTATTQTADTTSDLGNTSPAATAPETPATAATPSCNLHWILYDFNQATIRSDAQVELSNMATLLKENPEWLGVIDAHTDGKGSDDYNKKLSLSRAANAKAVLVKLGIAANRITTTASSKSDPIATNTDDDSGRQYNRRSELYIKDKTGKEVCKSIAPEVPGSLKVK